MPLRKKSLTSTSGNCNEKQVDFIFVAALILIAVNLSQADFEAYKALSPVDFLPVAAIVLLSFLLKTGILSALLIGIKKLRRWLWCK